MAPVVERQHLHCCAPFHCSRSRRHRRPKSRMAVSHLVGPCEEKMSWCSPCCWRRWPTAETLRPTCRLGYLQGERVDWKLQCGRENKRERQRRPHVSTRLITLTKSSVMQKRLLTLFARLVGPVLVRHVSTFLARAFDPVPFDGRCGRHVDE